MMETKRPNGPQGSLRNPLWQDLVSAEQKKNVEKKVVNKQDTILWANQFFEQYCSLPRGNHKERVRVEGLSSEAFKKIMLNPQDMDTVLSVWKSQGKIQSETGQTKERFYEQLKQSGAEYAKKHWDKINIGQLKQIIDIYGNSVLVQDMAGEILRGYFKGPQTQEERVNSLYEFTYALSYLTSKPKALEKGLKVARFESDLLTPDSEFRLDIELAQGRVDDELLLSKTIALNSVIIELSHLTGTYDERDLRNYTSELYPNKEKLKSRREKDAMRILRKMDPGQALKN